MDKKLRKIVVSALAGVMFFTALPYSVFAFEYLDSDSDYVYESSFEVESSENESLVVEDEKEYSYDEEYLTAIEIIDIYGYVEPFSVNGMYYLNYSIVGTGASGVVSHPASGPFTMQGVTHFRGIRNNSFNSQTITYTITEHGFTRLVGTVGRVQSAGQLTITGDNGVLLGAFVVTNNSPTINMDIAIPAGTQQVRLRFDGRLGIANAGFARGTSLLPPTVDPTPSGTYYLQYGIFGTGGNGIVAHPANGAFTMHGITHFRGIRNNSFNTQTLTFNTAGRGFTHLTGTLGRVQSGGSLTVTGDNGSLLGGFVVNNNSPTQELNIALPADTSQVVLRFEGRLGLANAALINRNINQPPVTPPAPQPPTSPGGPPTTHPNPVAQALINRVLAMNLSAPVRDALLLRVHGIF